MLETKSRNSKKQKEQCVVKLQLPIREKPKKFYSLHADDPVSLCDESDSDEFFFFLLTESSKIGNFMSARFPNKIFSQ